MASCKIQEMMMMMMMKIVNTFFSVSEQFFCVIT